MYSKINIENINKGFGELADVYDDMQFTNKPVQIMRNKFYDVIESLVKPGGNLFEINCGSGIDAVHFGAKGFNVLATDISDKMLRNAEAKNIFNNVKFMKMSFNELGDSKDRKFDLVYSNLGGLNCTDELKQISNSLSNSLNKNGYFVACVMPNFFIWEFLLFIKGEFSRAFRRMTRNWVEANVGEKKVNVKYYSPGRFQKFFLDDFQFIKTKALRIFAPAPPAEHFYTKHPIISKILDAFDNLIEDYYLSSFSCDYYIIVFRKL